MVLPMPADGCVPDPLNGSSALATPMGTHLGSHLLKLIEQVHSVEYAARRGPHSIWEALRCRDKWRRALITESPEWEMESCPLLVRSSPGVALGHAGGGHKDLVPFANAFRVTLPLKPNPGR